MPTLLYRLGRGAFRRRGLVLAAWLAALAIVVSCLAAFGGKLDNEFSIPGSESQQALDRMEQTFPAAAGTSAQIVFQAAEGHRITDPSYDVAVRRTLEAAGKSPQVAAVIAPAQSKAVSPDGRTAIAQVQYSADRAGIESGSLTALEDSVQPAVDAGLRVEVGGDAYTQGMVSVSPTELAGVLVALVVLTMTFGSLFAAGMPLLSSAVGVGVALSGLLASTKLLTISSTALTLALMLGLAVGIDYALFILSRHRRQLGEGFEPEESVARANATAGMAVVVAGGTVVIALAGLSVVRIPFLTVMGLSAAATVLIAVLVAVTLLPALMGFAGERLMPKRVRSRKGSSAGERWGRLVIRKPLATVLVVVAGLLVVAVPATDLELALPDNGSAATDSSERQAYDLISSEFGPGFNGPLLILADTPDQTAATELAAELRHLPGVAAVTAPQYAGQNALIQVIPSSGPEEQATRDLVDEIRGQASGLEQRTGAGVSVTGSTAVSIDVSSRLNSSFLPFVAVIVGLSLILLLIMFRSIIVPVKAALGFLLSVAASFGAVAAVFEWGWLADLLGVSRTGPVVSFLPIVLTAVLFGLAMDYEVFLVSSIREEWLQTGEPRTAVLAGMRDASRVVTAAALIMVFVFASFVTTHDAAIKAIAFALAFGVLVDALVIRMTLVPAVLALAGRWAWWLPGSLDRRLPAFSIEGDIADNPREEADSLPVG